MGRKPTPGAQDHILDIATRLFDAHGVRAVGLQQIIDECGCGKNLLYREFASKDELVAAYLQRYHDEWLEMVAQSIAPFEGDPAAQLIAIVKAIVQKRATEDYRGCPMHNTYAEFPEPDHPAHQVAIHHFRTVREQLLDLTKQLGVPQPQVLADRILLILDGLQASLCEDPSTAQIAVQLIEEIIHSATREYATT